MIDGIEKLLSEAVIEPPDHGFTARLVAKIVDEHIRATRRQAIMLAAIVGVLLFALPFTGLGVLLTNSGVPDMSLIVTAVSLFVFAYVLFDAVRD